VRNPFDWNYLTEVPRSDNIFGPFSIAYLVLFTLGLLATVIVNNRVWRIFPTHRLHRQTLEKIMYRAMWGWITGLSFFVFRFFGLNLLGIRLWEYVCLLAALGCVGFTYWWLRTQYPPRVEAFRKEQRRRTYLRPGSAGAMALAANTRSGATTRGSASARTDRQDRLDRADPANRATRATRSAKK